MAGTFPPNYVPVAFLLIGAMDKKRSSMLITEKRKIKKGSLYIKRDREQGKTVCLNKQYMAQLLGVGAGERSLVLPNIMQTYSQV